MNRQKKQHFVPQFLLRKFAPIGTEQLFVFDKRTSRSFKASIRDIAAENGFYDFVAEGATESIETHLAEFESIAARLVHRILEGENITHLDSLERTIVAALVGQLLLRPPHARAIHRDLIEKMRTALLSKGETELPADLMLPTENDQKTLTANLIRTETLRYAEILVSKDWMLQAVPSGCSLYLSDNPVALHNEVERPGRGNLGLRCPGIEIFLPISSDRCLALRCQNWKVLFLTYKDTYKGSKSRESAPPPPPELDEYIDAIDVGSVIHLKSENVTFLNSLQVARCERYVYSRDGDFELAASMLDENPELRVGPRAAIG